MAKRVAKATTVGPVEFIRTPIPRLESDYTDQSFKCLEDF